MPAPRPASPAALSTTDPVALNARAVWLVDAVGNVPDLAGNEPNLVLTGSPTYATTGALGGHLTGTGSASVTSNPLSPAITDTPFALGSIFIETAKSAATGGDAIFNFGDSTNASGVIFCSVYVDDGSNASPGDLIVQMRLQAFGNVYTYLGPSVDDGLPHAVAVAVVSRLLDPAQIEVSVSLDGTTILSHDLSATGLQFAGDSWAYASMLSSVNVNGVGNRASANLSQALIWYSTAANLTNGQYDTWTGDKWTILQASAPSVTRGIGFAR